MTQQHNDTCQKCWWRFWHDYVFWQDASSELSETASQQKGMLPSRGHMRNGSRMSTQSSLTRTRKTSISSLPTSLIEMAGEVGVLSSFSQSLSHFYCWVDLLWYSPHSPRLCTYSPTVPSPWELLSCYTTTSSSLLFPFASITTALYCDTCSVDHLTRFNKISTHQGTP